MHFSAHYVWFCVNIPLNSFHMIKFIFFQSHILGMQIFNTWKCERSTHTRLVYIMGFVGGMKRGEVSVLFIKRVPGLPSAWGLSRLSQATQFELHTQQTTTTTVNKWMKRHLWENLMQEITISNQFWWIFLSFLALCKWTSSFSAIAKTPGSF